jgi:hypothetical protein
MAYDSRTGKQSSLFYAMLRRYTRFLLLLISLPLLAQLSPGDLHRAHALLEGINNCTQCHSAGNRISPENCLDCHILLKERIQVREGLHARAEYRDCVQCHSDHHGRDFESIRWKGGKENFDHSQTGYTLEGAHAKQECNACHRAKNITDKEELLAKKKNLDRTFLGLNHECLSCHIDEHRGQSGKDCLRCHTMEKWKPAPQFNHDRTRFQLTGKHQLVDCQKCHKPIRDNRFPNDTDYLKFSGIPFARCLDCHEDFHRGRFGAVCETCHSTAGWPSGKFANFDHDKTRFPLQGRHKLVQCESCHVPGKPRHGLKFEKCMDCHTDYHRGQFADRASRGACEECHTVQGFSPSGFSIELHQKNKFPLEGGHLAVPCTACHAGGVNGQQDNRSMLKMNRFTFTSTRCKNCHRDPHRGEVDKYIKINGCEYCHKVESWRKITFDHSQTTFPLTGRHQEILCGSCHKSTEAGSAGKLGQFSSLSRLCRDCHEDIHKGQFETAIVVTGQTVKLTDCSRCHTPLNWNPDLFEHNRHSKFKLNGAHEKVPCQKCHPEVEKNGVIVALFKPLDTECSSCHGDSKLNKGIKQ